MVLGGIALRYGDSAFIEWAGHIGFGVRPSARQRGLATWALMLMLDEARSLGLHRLLAVCAVDNTASAKTIKRCGGVFERPQDTPFGSANRYWIDLDSRTVVTAAPPSDLGGRPADVDGT